MPSGSSPGHVSTRLRLIRRRKHRRHPRRRPARVVSTRLRLIRRRKRLRRARVSRRTQSFNPPPAHPPEETETISPARDGRPVSTRLRLIRRRKLAVHAAVRRILRFQPASGSSAGGNQGMYRSPWYPQRFNPPPAHPPEETTTATVSFERSVDVSTRLRLIRRRKQEAPDTCCQQYTFQPASGSSAGGNPTGTPVNVTGWTVSTRLRLIRRRKPPRSPPGRGRRVVSTRLRLIRRRKPGVKGVSCDGRMSFNPPPAHPPEETVCADRGRARSHSFQPASGSSAGGNQTREPMDLPRRARFNPPPAHPPEETPRRARRSCASSLFQPASGSSAGGNLPGRGSFSARHPVSTRLRLIRRRKPSSTPPSWSRSASFNPPPAHPPEETSGRVTSSPAVSGFNPPPAHPPEET